VFHQNWQTVATWEGAGTLGYYVDAQKRPVPERNRHQSSLMLKQLFWDAANQRYDLKKQLPQGYSVYEVTPFDRNKQRLLTFYDQLRYVNYAFENTVQVPYRALPSKHENGQIIPAQNSNTYVSILLGRLGWTVNNVQEDKGQIPERATGWNREGKGTDYEGRVGRLVVPDEYRPAIIELLRFGLQPTQAKLIQEQ
jgi:hypothetical protein